MPGKNSASRLEEPAAAEGGSERFGGCCLLPEHSVAKDQRRGIKSKEILRRVLSPLYIRKNARWEIMEVVVVIMIIIMTTITITF